MAKTIESFARFHRQKERLTEYVQIASAAIKLLQRNIDCANASSIMGAFVDACNVPHWGKGKKYSDPNGATNTVYLLLSSYAFVQYTSMFDIFSREAIKDAVRFSDTFRSSSDYTKHKHNLVTLSPQDRWIVSSCCNEVADKLGGFSSRIEDIKKFTGWVPSKGLSETLVIFDYIYKIRNRIVHSDSVVGADLEELSSSHKFQHAIAKFQERYAKKKIPDLPELKRGQPIRLEPTHAIFIGSFLYEIAKEVNLYISGKLTMGDFIDMAFFYGILYDDYNLSEIKHKGAEHLVRYILSSRYIRDNKIPDVADVIGHLSMTHALGTSKRGGINDSYWRIAVDIFNERLR